MTFSHKLRFPSCIHQIRIILKSWVVSCDLLMEDVSVAAFLLCFFSPAVPSNPGKVNKNGHAWTKSPVSHRAAVKWTILPLLLFYKHSSIDRTGRKGTISLFSVSSLQHCPDFMWVMWPWYTAFPSLRRKGWEERNTTNSCLPSTNSSTEASPISLWKLIAVNY